MPFKCRKMNMSNGSEIIGMHLVTLSDGFTVQGMIHDALLYEHVPNLFSS